MGHLPYFFVEVGAVFLSIEVTEHETCCILSLTRMLNLRRATRAMGCGIPT